MFILSYFCIPLLFLTRCLNNENENRREQYPNFYFEKHVCVGELVQSEDIDDFDLSPELLRLVETEDKQILPHQEATETINLDDDGTKKEVKISTSISKVEREKIVNLLR